MRLSELTTVTSQGHRVRGDAEITTITHDSRQVSAGSLFCCIPGERFDGHTFAPAAVAAGAAALLVERELELQVPQLVVPSVRAAIGPVASALFGDPSRSMTVVGVTGTNGKTTTTYILEQVFRALGWKPAVIGTVETRIGDQRAPGVRTTPEASDLQALLAHMRDAHCDAVAMEVSSHGLDQGRVDGTHFEAAVFTNLTQDHLDYHETMEDYFEAKALLFSQRRSRHAVINIDDTWGRRLAERIASQMPLVTTGMESEDADVRSESVVLGARGSTVIVGVGEERIQIQVPLPGRFNVSNALGVVGVARALGWSLDSVAAGIASLQGVPGRLESIEEGQPFTVLVDYAHTPDSLENVLASAREIVPEGGRLIVVFGCGGDRDRTKRPLMGAVGASSADRCIITSDNPRTEDPASIVEQIAAGARTTGRAFEQIVDRREAISEAIRSAAPADVIVIAGKGHETGQTFADHTIDFDDRIVAREILRGLS
ncbi:MAG: UDP-N-acetylmuramoyl-L-alanyl-D-glutamate--2,6-diaminopimelate ligase [Actinomycetota bacterium]